MSSTVNLTKPSSSSSRAVPPFARPVRSVCSLGFIVATTLAMTVFGTACKKHKPAAAPQVAPLGACVGDIECPAGTTCQKPEGAEQGKCARTAGEDGNSSGGSSAPAPLPSVTAAPGDLHL